MPSTPTAVRILSPLAYIAILMLAAIAVLLAVVTLEVVLGFGAPVFLFIIVELVAGGTVFFFGGWALLSLEELWRPRLLDHLRRCAFLYPLFVPLGILLLVFVDLGDPGAGGSLAIMLCVAAGYAIVIDALLLFVTSKRSRRPVARRYT